MRNVGRRLIRGSGQGLAEFAIVAPIFFMAVFGVIQLGLLFGAQNGLVNAVRDTARYAATYRVSDTADSSAACTNFALPHITAAKQQFMPGWISAAPQQTTVTYHWAANPAPTNTTQSTYFVEVIVQSTYAMPLYVPIVSNILDNTAPHPSTMLSAREEMRIENPALAYSRSDVTCSS
jgi:Flp pilus assembly protein TadG